MIRRVELGERSYEIAIERGILSRAGQIFNLNRRVAVVTDSGVPSLFAETVASQAADGRIFRFPQGEKSKNIDTWTALLRFLIENGFTRSDCVVAVGGGVVGDLAGFAAATYLRGIDFYQIPTTLLAQVDSSVGGKSAVDLDGYKNSVGAFLQPHGVLIDPDVLSTLDRRQVAAGFAEVLKVSLTHDPQLFALFEEGAESDRIEEVISRAVAVKAAVVSADEKEDGLRRVLNFGHTLGHGVETASGYRLLHGECVALGMLPFCAESVKNRLIPVLKRLGLPTCCDVSAEDVIRAVGHDKKRSGDEVTAVFCPEIGKFEFRSVPLSELEAMARKEYAV